jgi:kumamolisin
MQVTLDIEVVGAVAPDAHIVVYFAPNTNDGFLSAVEKAVADDINRPSVISISWGAPEANWTEEVMHSFDEAFQAAAAIGITVVCAAGDNGVTDGLDDGQAHVDFPASSPSVLACGGTRLTASELKVRSEVVWNDGNSGTGGGVSNVFALPEWQSKTNVPAAHTGHQGRGIPDVAANASPETGYSIYAHGRSVIVGGTAAATPLWAGLIALLNEGVGRNIGNIHSVLYDSIGPEGVLRAITEGHNGLRGVKGYVAGPGWNACAGWGSPNGMKLLQALRSHFRTAIDDDSTSTAADS